MLLPTVNFRCGQKADGRVLALPLSVKCSALPSEFLLWAIKSLVGHALGASFLQ